MSYAEPTDREKEGGAVVAVEGADVAVVACDEGGSQFNWITEGWGWFCILSNVTVASFSSEK
jgi:hypothetical protein